MRFGTSITLAVVALSVFAAPLAAASGDYAAVGTNPAAQDDGTMDECETTESMADGMNESTTESTDESMDNESMDDDMDNESMDEGMGNETMDEDMDNESMQTETTDDGMDEGECPTTEEMDDEMSGDDGMDGETTDEMDDEEMAETTDAEGSTAFAPGFGPAITAAALIAAGLYVARRR